MLIMLSGARFMWCRKVPIVTLAIGLKQLSTGPTPSVPRSIPIGLFPSFPVSLGGAVDWAVMDGAVDVGIAATILITVRMVMVIVITV